jgi:hypothetical protein
MNITELVKRASERPTPRPYSGDEDSSLSCKVTSSMLRDLDAVATYTEVSRSDALRSILSEALPSLIELCNSQGPNADGRTIADCRPRYYEDLSDSERAAVDAFEAR